MHLINIPVVLNVLLYGAEGEARETKCLMYR